MKRKWGCRPPRKGGKGQGKSAVQEKMQKAQARARHLGTATVPVRRKTRPTAAQRRGQKKAAQLRRGHASASAKLLMGCRTRQNGLTRGVTRQVKPVGGAVKQ